MIDSLRQELAASPLSPLADTRPATPDGPRLAAPLQYARMYRQGPAFLDECRERYGDTFLLALPGLPAPLWTFTRPEDARVIFTASPKSVSARAVRLSVAPFFGETGMILSEGCPHIAQRRAMNPLFRGRALRRYDDTFRHIIGAEFDRLPLGEAFCLRTFVDRAVARVFAQMVFGVCEPGAQDQLVRSLSSITKLPSVFLSFEGLRRDLGGPWPWSRFLRARRDVDAVVRTEIARRRQHPEETRDLLALLLEANPHMGDEELLDQLYALLQGGREVTSVVITWMVANLLAYPDVQSRVTQEIDALDAETGDMDALEQLPWLNASMLETLRLCPASPLQVRKAVQDVRIGAYTVPAGSGIAVASSALHRRDDLYEDPLSFRPERFVSGEPQPPYTFLPFGGAQRRCIGQSMALTMARVALTKLLGSYQVSFAPGARVTTRMRGAGYEPRGVRVILQPRG